MKGDEGNPSPQVHCATLPGGQCWEEWGKGSWIVMGREDVAFWGVTAVTVHCDQDGKASML